MAEEKHLFRLSSTWLGNSDGDGRLTCGPIGVDYGVPEPLGGKAGRSNPEEMLLGAVVSCYSITLSILAERKRLPVSRIDVDAVGEVVRQAGGTLKYVSIALRPRLAVSAAADEAQRRSIEDAAHKAEQYCVISNAIRGNVDVTVEPELVAETG